MLERHLLVVGGDERVVGSLWGRVLFVVVAGSTVTSTIPGISIAGPSPWATLYTPTLDVEYLVAGRPLTMNVVPVAPNGVPTPAVITRAVASALRLPVLVVDAGCFAAPRVPVVRLPSASTGSRIDAAPALRRGTARALFEEARGLARSLARGFDAVVVAETIPGGTTTAAAILEALGYDGLGKVSSSAPANPRDLKRRVVRAALSRLGPGATVFEVVDEVGDPVHPSVAGFAAGAAEAGAAVYLGGGTQMAAVLAVMREAGAPKPRAVLTTPWILADPSSSLTGLVEEVWSVPVVAARVSFVDAPFEGLRLYEKGYAKEGVGAGAAMVYAVANGLDPVAVKSLVYEEYARIASKA